MKNPNDPRSLSPATWCEYQILRKIARGDKNPTIYGLAGYASTLDECEKRYDLYNNMKTLVKKWQGQGIIKLERIHKDFKISTVELGPIGNAYLKKLDDWFGTPIS